MAQERRVGEEPRIGGKPKDDRGDLPRTDLPPKKIPYDDDYFGTGDEEGVERERQAGEDE